MRIAQPPTPTNSQAIKHDIEVAIHAGACKTHGGVIYLESLCVAYALAFRNET
jgi:hypothetical protein